MINEAKDYSHLPTSIVNSFLKHQSGTRETHQDIGRKGRMGLHSCSTGGEVDDSKFAEPLPWIGVYIAAASLLCSLLMGIDAFNGFRRRKLWFPCRLFSLNATSLTLLSVATKLPVDLNTSMPRPQDQLTKLSGTVLICTVMANFMISIGNMEESEMISNLIALGILVVTVIVNIAIQMGTGVIYVFLPEHALIMFFMLVLLVILCSTALTATTAKNSLKSKYFQSGFHPTAAEASDIDKMKDVVRKYWMLEHTKNPQYLVGRFATCTSSGAFCLLSALILVQAAFRSLIPRSIHFCRGKSDYTWSMTFVLISQAIAIVVGTIAPVIRWFNAIRFRSTRNQGESCKGVLFKVDKYWVQILEEWKENSLSSLVGNRRFRKIVHISRNLILDVLIQVQKAVGLVSNLIRLASMLTVSWARRLSSSCCCCKRRCRDKEKRLEQESRSNVDLIRSESDLKRFVLHLDEEEDLVQLIMTDCCEDVDHWIRRGKSKPPNSLLQLLKEFQGFQGQVEFNSRGYPSLLRSGISFRYRGIRISFAYCWALPVVTLTSIAITVAAASHVGKDAIKSLQRGVDESLEYVRLTDGKRGGYYDSMRNWDESLRARKAADIVWQSVDIYQCWLGNDLKKLARTEKTPPKILQKLADIGKSFVLDYTRTEKHKDPRHWPPKTFAANSMYGLCQTILLKELGTADQIFEWLRRTIAVVLVACLANFPKVMSSKCCDFQRLVSNAEESIRETAYLLGEAEIFLTEKLGAPCDSIESIDNSILELVEGDGIPTYVEEDAVSSSA